MNFLQRCYLIHNCFFPPRFSIFKHAQWSKRKHRCWVYYIIFLKKVSQHSQALPCSHIFRHPYSNITWSFALDTWKYCFKSVWIQTCLNLALGFSKYPGSWALVQNVAERAKWGKQCVIAYYFYLLWSFEISS